MLVVVALVVATTLAVPFLAAQSTSRAVGQNIAHHSQAQALAESGLELALAYIHQHPEWREQQRPGIWLADHAFAGGTLRVAVANEDPNEPADVLAEVVVLTSVGRVEGVSHTARVRLAGVLEADDDLLPYGVAVAERIEMAGNSMIDALDSREDVYHHTATGHKEAVVASNTTGTGDVALTHPAAIDGDMLVGPGGDPLSVIDNPAAVLGHGSLDESMTLPTVALPDDLPNCRGDVTISGAETLAAGTYCYDNLTLSSASVVLIEGDVTLVTHGTFALSNHAAVVLAPDATLTVYAEHLRFESNTSINAPPGQPPSAVRLNQFGSDDVLLQGRVDVVGVVVAPEAHLVMENNTWLFGAFQGKGLRISHHARLTQDLPVTAGDDAENDEDANAGYRVRWLPAE